MAARRHRTLEVFRSLQDKALPSEKAAEESNGNDRCPKRKGSKRSRERKPTKSIEVPGTSCNYMATQRNAGGSLGETDNEDQKENCRDHFKAKVKELRNESSMLTHQLKTYSDDCLQLQRENRILLDQLKLICGPDVIAVLEAKNPDKSPVAGQTDC